MPELTDKDRDVIARARKLAGAAGHDAVREHTGYDDLAGAYAIALTEAQYLLDDLADRLERLGS